MSKKQRELTQEEREKILKDVPPYIAKCGVKNHERAKYLNMLSKEVIGSTNSKFSALQPRIRDHSEYLEWNMAYAIVTNFLKDNNCQETLLVINNEFDNKSKPIKHPESLGENYEGNSTDFENLLTFTPNKTEAKFSLRVRNFLPYLIGYENNEEEEEAIEITDGAFLTQPSTIKQDNNSGEDGVIGFNDSQEEDDGELFSINDIDSDEVEDSMNEK